MASPKKILQLTNSEHGQANVHLAVASSIILSDPTVQIHIASYPRLADFVSEASDFAIQKSPEASPFVFHKLPGATFEECVVHKSVDFFSVARKTPGIWNSAALIKGVSSCCTPWNSEQFLETYEGVVQVIEEVDPDIIVVDCFFCPGLSVCHNAKRNWLILSPNSVKDFSLAQQPNLSGLWGFPRSVSRTGVSAFADVMCSGLHYS